MRKVLIADDVKDLRDMMRWLLQPYYDVIVARNGEEAWELFNAEKPDMVVTDLVMPRLKGDELCRRVKLQSFAPETLVVIVTAATKDRELSDGFWKKAAGCDSFISKPFSPPHLLEMVQVLFARRDAEAAGQPARGLQQTPLPLDERFGGGGAERVPRAPEPSPPPAPPPPPARRGLFEWKIPLRRPPK